VPRRERAVRRLREAGAAAPHRAASPRGWARRAGHVDAAFATLLALAGVLEVALSPDRGGPLPANVLVALGYTVPLAWRRRAPFPVTAAVIASILVMGLTLTSVEQLFVPFATVLLCAYTCGSQRQSLAGLALVVAALPAITATMADRVAADYFFPSLLVAVAWLAGRAVQARTRLAAELHEAAAQLAEASAEEQQLAAGEERRRIAREMHDLVAHSMSVMVVQAGGARRILERDPGRALEAATRIERTGREALGEMRHLLGVLNGPQAALSPQPTLDEIGELVARARAAGLPTVLEFRGERRSLPAGLDLAAYRIVQEGLTNALKHAGRAPTTVTVDWNGTTLTLEVRDHGEHVSRGGDGGHGLVGMRERVRLYGGELEAGPADGGGWRVRAVLPTGQRELSPA
jgi:signal transduction histidine kinase